MPPSFERPPDDAVRELARDVLARSEYAQWRESDALLAALRGLADFLDWLELQAEVAPVLFWLVMGALSLLALLLLAHVVVSLRAALRRSAPETGEAAPGAVPRFAEEALALAREGRFVEAAHRLQLACLDQLVRRGVIALARHDPNRTLRQRLRASPLPPAERDAFLSLVDRLERRWFRDRAEEPSLYRDWLALHERRAAGRGT